VLTKFAAHAHLLEGQFLHGNPREHTEFSKFPGMMFKT